MTFQQRFAELRGASADLYAGVREGHLGDFGSRVNAASEAQSPANFPPRWHARSPDPVPGAGTAGPGLLGGPSAAGTAGRGAAAAAENFPTSCRGKRSALASGGAGPGGAGAPPRPVLPYLPARSASPHPRLSRGPRPPLLVARARSSLPGQAGRCPGPPRAHHLSPRVPAQVRAEAPPPPARLCRTPTKSLCSGGEGKRE